MGITFNGTLSNSGISTQINRINCPMPQASGLWNNSGTLMYQNGTYNYPSSGNKMITLTCSQVHTLNGFDYFWGTQNVTIGGIHIQTGIPFAGIIFFVGDWLGEGVDKIIAIVNLIALNLIPPANIPPAVTNIVFFFIYIPMYIMIGVGLYGIFAPFKN